MNYTKYKIIRTKSLNPQISEVLFKSNSLNFSPGSRIKIYNTEEWYPVASGIKEPWTRILTQSLNFLGTRGIKIGEVSCMFPGLIDDKSPGFIVKGLGIAVPLSYISTFPDRKIEIVYLGELISLEFLKQRTDLKFEAKDLSKDKTYYVCGLGVKEWTGKVWNENIKMEFGNFV